METMNINQQNLYLINKIRQLYGKQQENGEIVSLKSDDRNM